MNKNFIVNINDWGYSAQRQDGGNNDYYFYPQNETEFKQEALTSGGISWLFISKINNHFEYHNTIVRKIFSEDIRTRMSTTTIKNVDISKKFSNTFIVAVPNNYKYLLNIFYNYIVVQMKQQQVEFILNSEDLLLLEDDNNLNPVDKNNKNINEKTVLQYNRSLSEKAKAIKKANFKCELDKNHITFISNITNNNFVEAHHLIPLNKRDEFEVEIDIASNIISLCPNCHKKLHFGKLSEKENLLRKLYKERISLLNKQGIFLSEEELIKMYSTSD